MLKSSKLYIAIIAIGLISTSCEKKIGDNQKITEPNTTVSDYMSTKEGSWWLYASADGEVVKRHATGKDSTVGKLIYNYYETVDTNTGAVTPEYFGLNQDRYLMLIDIDGTQTNYMPAILQKENAKVGDEWSNTESVTLSGIPLDVLIEAKVIAVDETMSIAGATFDNVTVVNNTLKAKTLGLPYVKCGTVKMWFSKGTGVVKTDFDLDVMSFYKRQYRDSLISYHIVEE